MQEVLQGPSVISPKVDSEICIYNNKEAVLDNMGGDCFVHSRHYAAFRASRDEESSPAFFLIGCHIGHLLPWQHWDGRI